MRETLHVAPLLPEVRILASISGYVGMSVYQCSISVTGMEYWISTILDPFSQYEDNKLWGESAWQLCTVTNKNIDLVHSKVTKCWFRAPGVSKHLDWLCTNKWRELDFGHRVVATKADTAYCLDTPKKRIRWFYSNGYSVTPIYHGHLGFRNQFRPVVDHYPGVHSLRWSHAPILRRVCTRIHGCRTSHTQTADRGARHGGAQNPGVKSLNSVEVLWRCPFAAQSTAMTHWMSRHGNFDIHFYDLLSEPWLYQINAIAHRLLSACGRYTLIVKLVALICWYPEHGTDNCSTWVCVGTLLCYELTQFVVRNVPQLVIQIIKGWIRTPIELLIPLIAMEKEGHVRQGCELVIEQD